MHSGRERAIVDDPCCAIFVRRVLLRSLSCLTFHCVLFVFARFLIWLSWLDSYGARGFMLVYKGTPLTRAILTVLAPCYSVPDLDRL